jgi:hypothetical protein
MASGFQTTGSASAVLTGLVLISITFGYNAALSRLKNLNDYSHFVDWFWAAGLANCIYFSYCFIISVHVTRAAYSYPNLVAIVLITCALLGALHVSETLKLYRVARYDWERFKRIFTNETIVVWALFLLFATLSFWAVFFTKTEAARYTMLLAAVRYTLVFASLRALFLVRYTFGILMNIATMEDAGGSGEEEEAD